MLGGANTRYEIVRKIARGGMGEVFLARQLGIGGFSKDVVLKQIHDTFADDPEFVNMFLEEARIAALLDHPNIVQIYGLGQQDRSHFIVMEYVPGLSVSRLIKKVDGPLPLHFGIQIAADVAAGLQFAHDKTDADGGPLGLVHRDVSPPNILVSTSGSVKITDFGIAKVKWSTTKTRAGVVKGKYSYLAPEQVQGDQADRQSDLYSLGLNLYEMTTGHRAYSKGDQILVLRNVAKGKFPPPEEVVPDYPAELRRVLMRALALDRKQRYTLCSQFQEDLLEVLARWGVNMNPAKLGQYVQEVMTPGEEPTPQPPPVFAAPEPVPLPEPGTLPDMDQQLASQDTQIVEMATVNLTASALEPMDTEAPTSMLASAGFQIFDAAPAPPPLPDGYPDAPAVGTFDVGAPTPPPAMVAGEMSVAAPVHRPTPAAGMLPPAVAVDYSSMGVDESDASAEAVRAAWANVHATAETHTGGGTSRLLLVAAVALVVVVLGVVILLVVTGDPTGRAVKTSPVAGNKAKLATGKQGETGAPAKKSAARQPPAAVEVTSLPPDAAPASAVPAAADAQPPVVESSPRPDLQTTSSEPPAAPAKQAAVAPPPALPADPPQPPRKRSHAPRGPRVSLTVSTDPITKVYLGRRFLGQTPLTTKIPKRPTTLVLRNRRMGVHTVRKINPRGSRISTHFVLRKGRIGFAFKTPQIIRVDGKFMGTTPRPPLVVFEGYHRVQANDRRTRRRFLKRLLVKAGQTAWVPSKK